MNDLGLSLVWLAIQVALVMVPSLVIQALASRRGPAPGAWVATWSLGLTLILGLSLVTPLGLLAPRSEQVNISESPTTRPADARPDGTKAGSETIADGQRDVESIGRTLTLETLRSALARLERKAVEPAARFRSWGRMLAIVALGGSLVGLIRLMVGLWAIGHCRRVGRVVEDPAMVALVEELRQSMGCLRPVEIREVADLATPATAGWRRPMVLLPDNWRSWDDSERRAVIAHEFAHILRGDYAAGLVARFAVVLHAYHPLVRWMAGRLTLQQELAADAIGAEFAGGRESYLLALSRLVLKQEGRSPTWPARAFLPPRGTLIRRIKMLRNENGSKMLWGWSKSVKMATGCGLVALTVGVASWRAPVLAADEPVKVVAEAKNQPVDVNEPFEMRYILEGKTGVVAFRPAAMFRRTGLRIYSPLVLETMLDPDLNKTIADAINIDSTRPGFIKLVPEDIESIVSTVNFYVAEVPENFDPTKGRSGPKRKMHALEFGELGGLTVRMVAPFDWLAFLRQWKVGVEEVRVPRGVYYRIKPTVDLGLKFNLAVYLPDNRTLVYEREDLIKEFLARETPRPPAYLRGSDWDRVSHDLLAVAVDNHADSFAKIYDLGRANDKVVLNLIKGIDRLTFGLADSDQLDISFELTALTASNTEASVQAIRNLVKLGQVSLKAIPRDQEQYKMDSLRMAERFLANLRVDQDGRSVHPHSDAIGSVGDLAAIIKSTMEESKRERDAAFAESKKQVEAEAKKIKR